MGLLVPFPPPRSPQEEIAQIHALQRRIERTRTLHALLFLAFIISLICVLMCGCSHTTFYDQGKPIVSTQANIRGFSYAGHGVTIHADEINHSTPTLAGGKAISGGATAFGTAATGLATGLLAHGL